MRLLRARVREVWEGLIGVLWSALGWTKPPLEKAQTTGGSGGREGPATGRIVRFRRALRLSVILEGEECGQIARVRPGSVAYLEEGEGETG